MGEGFIFEATLWLGFTTETMQRGFQFETISGEGCILKPPQGRVSNLKSSKNGFKFETIPREGTASETIPEKDFTLEEGLTLNNALVPYCNTGKT